MKRLIKKLNFKARLRAHRLKSCKKDRLSFERGYNDALEFKRKYSKDSYLSLAGPATYHKGFIKGLNE